MPAPPSAEKLARWLVELHARGLKATPSRLAVLGLLAESKQPLSHSEIAAQLSEVYFERTTIFRNLTDLCDVGLLRRFDCGDHTWRFEIVDDSSSLHAHLVCSECGKVSCLSEVLLDELYQKLLALQQTPAIMDVIVKGQCSHCVTASANAEGLQSIDPA